MDSLVLRLALFSAFICVAFTNKTNSGNLGFRDGRHVLMSQLTESYDRRILPVINRSHAVDVQYEMELNQIVQLVEREQFLVTSTWVRLYWRDEFLTWDPADYDGIEKVYLGVDSIWKPDVVLHNSVDEERTAFEVFPAGVAGVTHEGEVSWFAPVTMQSTCKIKVDAYPFDKQKCPLSFGSWSYDGLKLNFTSKSDKIKMNNYVTSVEWEVLDTPCQTDVYYYGCCPEPYTEVLCHIVMRRRPAFYLFNLVLPTALLLIIGLVVFCLPPESGEKVSLAITVLLSISVYELAVMDNLPPYQGAIPLLESFFCGTMILLTLSTVMAVFVVNFHFRGSYSRPPYWVRCCCMGSILTTICCLRKEVNDIEEEDTILVTTEYSNNAYAIENNDGGVSLKNTSTSHRAGRQKIKNTLTSFNHIEIPTMDRGTGDARGGGTGGARGPWPPRPYGHGPPNLQNVLSPLDATHNTLQQILVEVRHQSQHMHDRYKEKKADNLGEAEWRVVAMTVDRLFFVILLTISLIMSFVVFKDIL